MWYQFLHFIDEFTKLPTPSLDSIIIYVKISGFWIKILSNIYVVDQSTKSFIIYLISWAYYWFTKLLVNSNESCRRIIRNDETTTPFNYPLDFLRPHKWNICKISEFFSLKIHSLLTYEMKSQKNNGKTEKWTLKIWLFPSGLFESFPSSAFFLHNAEYIHTLNFLTSSLDKRWLVYWHNILFNNRHHYTANYFSVISTDYWCIIIPLTDASEFSRFLSVIYDRQLRFEINDIPQ